MRSEEIGRTFMPIKNPEWAIEQLEDFMRLHELVPIDNPTPGGPKQHKRGTLDERRAQREVVARIAAALWVDPPRFVDVNVARSCLFELRRGEEMDKYLGVTGGPVLVAGSFHPWVWNAAEPHWNSDNHDAAVWAAGINVNSRMRAKVGRHDLGEVKLIQAVFSLKPATKGNPRLRLCDKANPDLFNDRHIGAMQLGVGLFAGVRNPVNHLTPEQHDLSQQEALESLAAFSLFARWVDQAKVETV